MRVSIPELNLSSILESKSDAYKKLANDVRNIYSEVGFAYITGHGVSENILDCIYSASKQFHSLPLEYKMTIKQNDCFRGYVPINASQLKLSTEGAAKKPNQLDAFVMAFEASKEHPDYQSGKYLAGPNQWPDEKLIPGFNKILCLYRDEMLKLSYILLKIFSIALNIDNKYIKKLFAKPSYFLILQHYIKQSEHMPEDQFGIAPHTDYGFFTILAQNNVAGLQIRTFDNKWIDVPFKKDAFILNSGDMMKIISKNKFKSTPHRVINRSGVDRYSVPFFFEPNMYAEINKPDGTVVMYGDYLLDRIQKNYDLGKKS